MKKFAYLSMLSFFLFASTTTFAQNEKDLVIKTARALEAGPLDGEARKAYGNALRWVIETDEVSIIACGGVFSLFSDKKNKNSSDMTAAYTIGMAAFKLENPEKAKDENAAQLAGLQTALKTYEGAVKEKPKNKFEKVEALIEKRNSDQLAGVVNAADCGKK
jgi:hypothetical protein